MDRHLSDLNDMLEGNINRMNVTDSKEELEKMYVFASLRLAEIFNISRERILRAQIDAKYKRKIAKIDPFWDNLGKKVNDNGKEKDQTS